MALLRKGVFMKKGFCIVAALCAAMVIASCYSYPVNAERFTKNIRYWDEGAPKEESVELFIQQGLTVTSYNEISVDWGQKALVYLPPGEVVFTLDLDFYTPGNMHYTGDSVFAWNFKIGDRFVLMGDQRDGKPGVLLWDLDVKRSREESAFFPFPEGERRVLE
jgi:hypothetical protein